MYIQLWEACSLCMWRITAVDFTAYVVLLQPLFPKWGKKTQKEQELIIPIFFTVPVKKTNTETFLPFLRISLCWLSICCTSEDPQRTICSAGANKDTIWELILSVSQVAEGTCWNFPNYLLPLSSYKIKALHGIGIEISENTERVHSFQQM